MPCFSQVDIGLEDRKARGKLPNDCAKDLTARPLQEACCGRGRRKARLARVRGVCDGL